MKIDVMEQAKGTKQTNASCVYAILCSGEGPAQRNAWLPKRAGGHWPADAHPTDVRVPAMAGRGFKKLQMQAV